MTTQPKGFSEMTNFKKNKQFLLNTFGYDSINQAKKDYGISKADDLYEMLMGEYNDIEYENFKQEKKRIAKEKKDAKAEAKAKKVEILYESVIQFGKSQLDNPYTYLIHTLELKKLKSSKIIGLFQQTVNFYDENGNIVNIEKFKTRTFETINIDAEFIQHINFALSEHMYVWIAYAFFEEYPNGSMEIITKALKQIASRKKKQTYADSNTGTCVYDSVVKYFEAKPESDRNAKACLNRLDKHKVEFAKTYTDESIADIGVLCNSSITIKNLINGLDKVFNENSKNRFRIQLMNTKFNHLDLLVANFSDIQYVSEQELKDIKQVEPFYIEKFGSIITLDATYKKKESNFKHFYDNWKEAVGYESLFILHDSDEYRMLQRYDYKLHTFFNEWKVEDSLYVEKDLKKAYFNYSNINYNPYYMGVPSGSFINVVCNSSFDFEKITRNGFIGFYEIQIIHSNLDARLGLINKSIHYLMTPTIQLLLKNNVIIKFLNASYSTSTHIGFDCVDGMQEKENDIKHYCKAFGLMLCLNDTIDIKVKPLECDYDYFDTIDDEDLLMYRDHNIVKIRITNKQQKSYLHLAYALHAYTQTLVLEKLIEMDMDDVYGCKLDSIVLKDSFDIQQKYSFGNQWDDKDANIEKLLLKYKPAEEQHFGRFEQDNTGYYRPYIMSGNIKNLKFKQPMTQTGEYIENRIVFLGGKGGSGKTTSILNAFDKRTICYTSMCWNLIQAKMSENIGLIGHSIPQLTGGDGTAKCEKVKNVKIRQIFIDEATLINESVILKIIELYPNAMIIIAGDIDEDGFFYQCSMQNGKLINPSTISNLQYIRYTKSYRFSQELNDKLDKLRLVMKTNDKLLIHKLVHTEFKNQFFHKSNIDFGDDDVGISATDDLKNGNELTNYFIENGAKPRYFIKKTNVEQGQLRGREIFGISDLSDVQQRHKNYEMKLFKTIHSFQGLELSNTNNIIINVDKMFDINLYYTALSRARRIDQIKIIDSQMELKQNLSNVLKKLKLM